MGAKLEGARKAMNIQPRLCPFCVYMYPSACNNSVTKCNNVTENINNMNLVKNTPSLNLERLLLTLAKTFHEKFNIWFGGRCGCRM